MSELTLHTIDPPQPSGHRYEAVVGITVAGRNTVWDRNPYTLAEIDPAEPTGTTAQSFDVPARIGDRASSFLMDRIMLSRHLSLEHKILLQYNCHSFASFVADDRPVSNAFFGERRARKIMDQGVTAADPPPAGRQLVIGGIDKARRRHKARPEHSMISLGEADPRCLQVTSLWGHMALARYDDVFRAHGVGEEDGDNHVYVRAA